MEHCCISERDCLPPQQVRLAGTKKRSGGRGIQLKDPPTDASDRFLNGRGGDLNGHIHTAAGTRHMCRCSTLPHGEGGNGTFFELNQGGRWRPSQLAADLKVADVHSYFPPLPALFLQTQKNPRKRRSGNQLLEPPLSLRCSRTQFSHRLSHRPTARRDYLLFNVIKSFSPVDRGIVVASPLANFSTV